MLSILFWNIPFLSSYLFWDIYRFDSTRRSVFIINSALFIEGVIEEKYFIKPEERAKGKTSDYAFKPRNMMLLGNVTDTYVKGFSIQLSTPMLSQEFREKLVKMIKKNKGNVPLTMFLYDPENKWNIEFLSRKFKVAVTADLLDELRSMNITWKLLKK